GGCGAFGPESGEVRIGAVGERQLLQFGRDIGGPALGVDCSKGILENATSDLLIGGEFAEVHDGLFAFAQPTGDLNGAEPHERAVAVFAESGECPRGTGEVAG